MANVRFIQTTKQKWLDKSVYDPAALYFCMDTGEIFKGSVLFTEGVKLVPTRDNLPSFECAADGVLYYIVDTRAGFMISPNRDAWLQTIYAPIDDVNSIPEGEEYNVVTTVGAVRDIEKKLYDRIDEVVSGDGLSALTPVDGTISIVDVVGGGKSIGVVVAPMENNALITTDDGLFVPTHTAGSGIEITDNKIGIKLADITHGLVAVDGALTINLATKDSDGAMSKEDKHTLDVISDSYVAYKYEISHKPDGTIVDYRDKEIRIMCPSDTNWKFQNSGVGADSASYYIGFKAYAPDNAVRFKEDLAEIITDNEMYSFYGNSFAGIDDNGCKYSIVWLPVAKYTNGAWNYYGADSTKTKYIGWYYTVEWYSEDGRVIDTDTIRINLSNEDCHNNIKSFYGVENDVSTDIAAVQETVAALEQSYTWGEI